MSEAPEDLEGSDGQCVGDEAEVPDEPIDFSDVELPEGGDADE